MPGGNALVLIYDTSLEAGGAVQVLVEAGFDRGEISVVGRPASLGSLMAEGCKESTPKAWSGVPGFWKEMSALLGNCAPHELPDLGSILIAGSISSWMTVALANAAIFGGLDALGAVLHSLGVPRETIHQGEAALKQNSYLVVVHGPAREIARAKRIVDGPGLQRLSP